jgi:hypothetical protein
MSSTMLWQLAFVLLLLTLNFTTAATLVTGVCIGFWFCVLQLALAMEVRKNEKD